MVQRRLRSRNRRKIHVKVPGGRVTIQYRKRKPKSAHCSNCGSILKGIPREFPKKMGSLAKSKKRPQRPYGGVLCSACMRHKILEKVQ